VGRSYLFECPKCGYNARVSGGVDRGLMVFVQTILCRDCKELYDAVVRQKVPDQPKVSLGFSRLALPRRPVATPPAFESALNHLLVGGARHWRWISFKVRCPVSPVHRVQPWTDPGNCPKCGLFLEKNALPFRIWD
jgi:hypothetical protein